jgi:hypothetical protein
MNDNTTKLSKADIKQLAEADFFCYISDYYTVSESGELTNRYGVTIKSRKNGWIYANYAGRQFYVHRFILWLWSGKLGKICDHINRDRADNRPENLRWVTDLESRLNTNGKLGYEIITNSAGETRYLVRVSVSRINKTIGTFTTPEAALHAKMSYIKHFSS